MSLAVVTLKKGEGRFLKSGGLWVYDNEIASIMGSFVNGDIVLVHDFDGYPMGRGFINTNSKIAVRMLTRDEHREINEDFLRQRVRDAWEYRKKVVDTGSCRVIFGEADFLPGLVVDKFSDVLVVQSLALGIDRLKGTIIEALKDILAEDGIQIRGVYERSDAKVRRQEGMELTKGFIGEEFPTIVQIEENGVKYEVDVKDGQKTGFFLDQKYNRLAVQNLCRNLKPAKVYRNLFDADFKKSRTDDGYTTYLKSPLLKDVTAESGYPVLDLRIEADKAPSSAESLVYLCAYNYYEWKPIAIGIQTDAVCEFKDVVGNNIFIIAEGDKEQDLKYVTAPFLVDSSGHIRKFIPDKNRPVRQELWIEKGKTPRNLHFWDIEKEYFVFIPSDNMTSDTTQLYTHIPDNALLWYATPHQAFGQRVGFIENGQLKRTWDF